MAKLKAATRAEIASNRTRIWGWAHIAQHLSISASGLKARSRRGGAYHGLIRKDTETGSVFAFQVEIDRYLAQCEVVD